MATVTFTKDPNERLDFTISYADELSDVADSISSSSWTVEGGLTHVSNTTGTTSTTIWLSGGTDGTSYTLTNQVTTVNSPSRIYRQPVIISVKAKP